MRRRALVLSLWLAGIAALALWLASSMRMETDLSQFLPAAASLDEQVLLAQMRSGVAARTLLVALEGAVTDTDLAAASRGLAAALRADPHVLLVANGEPPPLDESALGRLAAARYLIGPADACVDALSADGLRTALKTRLAELGSAVPAPDQRWIAEDPTGCLRALLKSLVPARAPPRRHGVWFSPGRERALLVIQTAGDATDLDAERAAVEAIRAAFAALPQAPGLRLELAGPGYFTVASAAAVQQAAATVGIAAFVTDALILFFAFRSPFLVLVGALPGLAGLAVGLTVVQLGYGFVHGIALALGTTLFGVALDYPAHVFSHVEPGVGHRTVGAGVWPTLVLAAATTVLGYGALALTDFQGLAQVGILAAAGLATAALSARLLLPSLVPGGYRVPAHPWLDRDWSPGPRLARYAPWVALALAGAVLALTLAHHPQPWEADLRRLSTVPPADIARDTALRAELGAPDVTRFLYATAPDPESLLQTLEAALPGLRRLVDEGTIAGFDAAPLWLPSRRTQAARQAALPGPEDLTGWLVDAGRGLPFRPGAFAPFLGAVDAVRTHAPLTPADLADTLIGLRLSLLIQPLGGQWLGLIPLTGVPETGAEGALRAAAAAGGLHYLDLGAATTALLARFLDETLSRTLGLAAAIVLVLAVGLRDPRRLLRVLLPMAIALTLGFCVTVWTEGSANLFNLVSLLLVLGLAIDYSLFFNRPVHDAQERRHTLLSLTVCAWSTSATFGLLALSGIPVLRSIGTTVAVGSLLAFVLAALLARGGQSPAATNGSWAGSSARPSLTI